MTLARWQFRIDRGGTFTNVVARRLHGAFVLDTPGDSCGASG